MGAWKFWGAVAILVGSMWMLAYWLRKRRTAALKTAAEKLELDFRPNGNPMLIHRLAGFDLSSRYPSFGDPPLENLMHRESNGQKIAIFDYRCRRKHSDNNPTTMTLLLIEWAEFDLPTFVACPESIFKRISHALGGMDIDFPDHPEFSRKFVLRGENEEKIREVMTDEVIRAFERHTGVGVSGISVEGCGSRLLVYHHLRTVRAAGLGDFLSAGMDIAELLARASRR